MTKRKSNDDIPQQPLKRSGTDLLCNNNNNKKNLKNNKKDYNNYKITQL